MQPGYFCRFFKKCMGVTFLEYQNELRLSYIYRDLITTEDSVRDILERHGFTNYKLFRRCLENSSEIRLPASESSRPVLSQQESTHRFFHTASYIDQLSSGRITIS